MDAKGASVVLSLFLISETNKGKTTTMKTKLKKVVPSASCLVLSAKKMLAVALCAVGLSAFAEESVTINEVKSVQPWDKAKGTITVDYSLGGLDAAKEYKVAFDITAGGQTASVTNDATKLTDGAATKEIDTAKLFGKQVVDTKAKVKVSLIAIKPKPLPVVPEGFVDLGVKDADGKPLFWAEKNLGASKPEEYGKYYSWGDVTGQTPLESTFSTEFSWDNDVFGKTFQKGVAQNKACPNGILAPAYDAATQADPNHKWRTPTQDEFVALAANCVWIWCDGNKEKYNNTTVIGYIVYKAKNDADKGKAKIGTTWKKWDVSQSKYVTDGASEATGYTTSDTHIFFPAAGRGDGTSFKSAGSLGYYWSSSLRTDSTTKAWVLQFNSDTVNPQNSFSRYFGHSVRPVVKEVK